MEAVKLCASRGNGTFSYFRLGLQRQVATSSICFKLSKYISSKLTVLVKHM